MTVTKDLEASQNHLPHTRDSVMTHCIERKSE